MNGMNEILGVLNVISERQTSLTARQTETGNYANHPASNGKLEKVLTMNTEATVNTVLLTAALTFTMRYNFKAISKELYDGLFENGFAQEGETKEAFYARIQPQFEFPGLAVKKDEVTGEVTETVKDKTKYAKRLSVEVKLNSLPQLADLTAAGVDAKAVEFITAQINKTVADFVKSQYIDAFQPVGVHDLSAILEFQAKSGTRGGGFSIDEVTLKEAIESFGICMAEALGNQKGGDMLANIAKGRFTASSVSRGGLTVSEETASKLMARVDQWANWLNINNTTLADEYSVVHSMWTTNIEKLVKAGATFDLESVI